MPRRRVTLRKATEDTNLVFIGILIGSTALAWWLSGYDSMVLGEDLRVDFRRRAARCGVTLLLLAGGLASSWVLIVVALPIALIWAGCLSELFASGFQRLVYPVDNTETDLNQVTRDLDQLARLVQDGRKEEAIEWCRRLRESGDVSAQAIDAVIFQLEGGGVPPGREEATEGIESLLVNRGDARRVEPACGLGRESVDQMLADGRFASAVEKLEDQIKDQPQDFALWLKLAEAHGLYCHNHHLARKIVGRIEANPAFTKEQVDLALSKLREWRGKIDA